MRGVRKRRRRRRRRRRYVRTADRRQRLRHGGGGLGPVQLGRPSGHKLGSHQPKLGPLKESACFARRPSQFSLPGKPALLLHNASENRKLLRLRLIFLPARVRRQRAGRQRQRETHREIERDTQRDRERETVRQRDR